MHAGMRALNRFGLGAFPGERDRVGDGRDWLHAQLAADPASPVAPAAPAEIADVLRQLRRAGQGSERERQAARQRLTLLAANEQRAALTERVRSERPFVERLVAFWSNHLCVSVQGKQLVLPVAGAYERDVIRAHVLGRFADMVLASAQHPAMLFYLDNFQSIGPASAGARQGAQRAGAARGLNENYARELLELHTLGVDGGYTQEDVVELARALTGWSVAGIALPGIVPARPRAFAAAQQQEAEGPLRFIFRELLHEPGTRTLLGRSYAPRGVEQARHMIRDLCGQPATARFIATKLVTHFVADTPPAAAVDRIAGVFQRSEGDLRAVSAALVDLPEAWAAEARKFRTPQDWLVAALRALPLPPAHDALPQLLRQLRQPLWSPPSPQGYGDGARDWSDPGALLNRAELARSLARRAGGRRMDPSSLADVVDIAPADALHGLLADASIPADERVALLLASPAFQWR